MERTNAFDSTDIIIAAGESSQTDTEAFIQQQRWILAEFKSPKGSDHNRHAVVEDEGRKGNFSNYYNLQR